MLVPVDHRGAQRGMRLGAVADIDAFQRRGAGQHLGRADRQPGAAQQAAEGEQVGGQRPAAGARPGGQRQRSPVGRDRRSAACFASATSRAASAPRILAMSSWYFSSAPSVSSTAAGSSSCASSADSAAAQSMVSATPGSLKVSALRSACTKATTWADRRSATPGARSFRMARSRAASG